MRVAIDGVQRRQGYTLDLRSANKIQAAKPIPRLRPNPPIQTYPVDGMMRQLATAADTMEVAPLPVRTPARLRRRSVTWARVAMALVVLASAVGVGLAYRSAGTATAAQSQPTPTQPSHSSTPAVAAGATASQLQAIINQSASTAGVPTGIETINLANGATATSNADAVFTSASIYKLFVADVIYQDLDNGSVTPGQTAGTTGYNVTQCLNYMITISDNACGEALGNIINWDSQNSGLHTAGFTHTLLRRNDSEQTSASDVALLLQRLYQGTLLSPVSSTAFLNLLKAQKVNNRLPVGLPAGTVIAHKTGDLNGLVHDAGIIYTSHGDYIVVALTGPWAQPGYAPAWFSELSSQLYAGITAPPAPH